MSDAVPTLGIGRTPNPRGDRLLRPLPAVEDLAARQRALIDLDAELSRIAVAAAERGFALSTANAGIHDPVAFAGEVGALGSDLDEIVRRVARCARALCGAEGAAVEVVDGADTVHRAKSGPGAARRGRSGVVPDQPWRSPVVTTLRQCEDTETDPRVDSDACRRRGTRCLITVPLRHQKRTLGAVTVTSSQPHAFDDGHAVFLRLLARRVTASVMRLRLIEELRKLDLEHMSALVASESIFRQLFYQSPQPMWVLDGETGRFLAVNDAAVAKYGYSAEEFLGMTGGELRRDPARYANDFARGMAGPVTVHTHHRLRDGRLIDVEIAAGPQEFNGRPAILSIINDVTERNRLERELRAGAFRDPLTGRANRVLFAERAGHALTRTQRHSSTVAVLFVDVDNFKVINDSMGYTTGDAVLQAVADRLAVTLRPGDTVARLGADEFAVLLEDAVDAAHALDVAERLADTFAAPLEYQGGQLTIGLSIGVAVSSVSGPGATELLRDAELAMQAAKRGGRGRVEVFSPNMRATAIDRLSLDQDLRHAVDRDELRVYYQPLISMRTGAVTGCEALVRWQHPIRGLVPPDSFIPLAEETGVIAAIDTWVLRTACTQTAAWLAAGHPDLFVAVNVSGRELGRADLVDRVEGVVFESGLPPDHLEIEITETATAAQPTEALEELRQLRRAGISVAIDDFGTGYSSLNKLATFPVDRLKIDRSFLSTIRNEQDDDPLVAAMIGLGHRLGLQVTAEGVETAAQLAFLRRCGCDLLQGYLFSPPVPADRFEELLGAGPQPAWAA
jgi:diguanylate cyclase (GGDEF)-like protein/PAS domain S-box-containing protein